MNLCKIYLFYREDLVPYEERSDFKSKKKYNSKDEKKKHKRETKRLEDEFNLQNVQLSPTDHIDSGESVSKILQYAQVGELLPATLEQKVTKSSKVIKKYNPKELKKQNRKNNPNFVKKEVMSDYGEFDNFS